MRVSPTSIFLRASGLAVAVGMLSALMPSLASAQSDSILVTTRPQDQTCCWNLKVKNANSQHQVINHVVFAVTSNDGTSIVDAKGPSTWNVNAIGDTVYFDATGASIAVGATLAGFDICMDNVLETGETVSYTTYNNTTVLSTGTLFLYCTGFQTFKTYDSVSVIASSSGTDPRFQFRAFDRNDLGAAIDGISFQILDNSAGTIRPSNVQPPPGWLLDSVNATTAFFHTETDAIVAGTNTDGFKVAMRGNPNVSQFGWVWRAYTLGLLIDRDTIRGVRATASPQTAASQDTVTATKNLGCLYTFNLGNYHATNANPPSRLHELILNSTTAGVKFTSASPVPHNWGKSISVDGDSLYFKSSSDTDGIGSGLLWSTFGALMDNPSGGNFTIHWQTLRSGHVISSGDLPLSCAQGAAVADTATLADGDGTCCYRLTVSNRHNSPPSGLYGISLSITDGSGTFEVGAGKLVSSLNWGVSAPSSTSVRFSVPSSATDFQPSNTSQDILFCVVPKTSGQPVNFSWQTYDINSTAIEGPQALAVTCSPVVTTCDSIWVSPQDTGICLQNFGVYNRRTNPVTKIVVTPLNGWLVDSATAPIPWTSKIDGAGSFVTFSSSQGIPGLTPQAGFMAGFVGHGTANAFNVSVATTNIDDLACYDTLMLSCTASSGVGVSSLGTAYSLSLTANPNPFHQKTEVNLSLPIAMRVNVEVVDVLGRTVQTLVSGMLTEGAHPISVDGANLVAGTYYVRVQSPVGVATKKIVLQK